MKNFFFGISALALLLVGCDGGTLDPNEVDPNKPDASPASKPDAVPSGPITCPIPASTLAYPKVSTVPVIGYRLLVDPEHFFCATFTGSAGPTDCSSPVNGFANTDNDPWCCVHTFSNPVGGGSKVVSASMMAPSLLCSSDGLTLELNMGPVEYIPGRVALCSSSGKFMGWDCNAM